MKFVIIIVFFSGLLQPVFAFEFSWEIDETPEGSESATVVEPVEVVILGETVSVPSYSASLRLMRKYSVHLGPEWSAGHAYRLLQMFESIPQRTNNPYHQKAPELPTSVWHLSSRHLANDIEIEDRGAERIVTIAEEAFVYAAPLLAKIDGVWGRYFSKRLHRAVVRFVTDDGANRRAIDRILEQRYAVSVRIPDYTELTRNTTQEYAGRFQAFKNEELITIVSMLEEYPSGMLQTPGLKYLVRRLDGLWHPLYPGAAAVAWTGAGYIEFMESAFKKATLPSIQRLVLHEKAHFLWAHLFDEQLKQDWIEIGGWYENPDDKDGWSTTKQVEFVSAYAHGVNPNEDMAESISFYIVDPDKLRSRSPAKYAFIQNRVMHGTRYISRIREDLTFQVYNLWPDYVYPGRIIGVDIQVAGAPEADKQVTITLQLHGESDLDTATRGYTRVFSEKDVFEDVGFHPIDENGHLVRASHVLRGHLTLSRYAPSGYWAPDTITVGDANESERHSSQTDFGWKLYIDNSFSDCEPPEYVPNSMRLSLSEAKTNRGERYQIITARWGVIEATALTGCSIAMNDEHSETYSIGGGTGYSREDGRIVAQKGEVEAKIIIPDYKQSGVYQVSSIGMGDIAGNLGGVFFTKPAYPLEENERLLDEAPATIEIQTWFPDSTPPELDLNTITIKAEPTNPDAPNGETRVDITFRVRDDIAGYDSSLIHLRDPQGVRHGYSHYTSDHGLRDGNMYFTGDPTVYRTYQEIVVLPIGSPPGTWGLSDMTLYDKAENTRHVDFTEIVRFEIIEIADSVILTLDVNNDGEVNIQDLVFVASNLGETGENAADVNGDGIVDILDIIAVAGALDPSGAAPALDPQIPSMFTVADVQKWISEAQHLNLTDPTSQSGIRFLAQLLTRLMPKETVLLPNYPNPFNPETWIPYQLSEPAGVTLTIYAANGQVVRQMSLGHQSAGIYQSRMRAVYWDGRNAIGEPVASGFYFYTLTAGDFIATRKMLIRK